MINLGSAFKDAADRRSPLLTGIAYSQEPCASTQIHHLIPQELWNDPKDPREKPLFDDHMKMVLGSFGGAENPLNLMELPATINGAMSSNLALHNGSHPEYTNEVRKELSSVILAYKAAELNSGQMAADSVLVMGIAAVEFKLR